MLKVNKGFENENGKLKCDCAFIDCQCINEIKKEVARDIFKDIDNTIYADTDFFKMLRKKYIGE